MSDLKIREAFDSDSVPLKNIALKKAHDRIEKLEAANLQQSIITVDHLSRIEKLEAGEIEFDRIIGDYASENARFRDRIEKLEAALRSIAANACCDNCREAALVARKALEGKDD